MEPGGVREFELDLTPGWIHWQEFMGDDGLRVPIGAGHTTEVQRASLTFKENRLVASVSELSAGKLLFSVENLNPYRTAFVAFLLPPEFKSTPMAFEPYLTGKQVLNSQTFRNLFRSEVIDSAAGIQVMDLTVLFTDLKGSTALYDRIGDLNAFALVRDHFESLGKVIVAHEGAIVKTIGDAVMATFIKPDQGLRAAIAILKEIGTLNKGQGTNDIILKIGLHKGALIAVTLNDRLDYFGQTVNIAARVQGLAEAEEIYVTEGVYRHPGVSELLQGFNVKPEETRLKGIERAVAVYKITT
jgi:class 3 adenylate cyclase